MKNKKKLNLFNLDSDKSSHDDSEAFIVALAMHALEAIFPIYLGAPFHMAPHWGWFMKCEEY